MKKICTARIFSLSVVLLSGACFAWGRDGHRIIGAIAEKLLTEKTKAALKDLLGDQTLADAGNWADEIRSDKSYDWAKPLHYINVPRDAKAVDEQRDCNKCECVTCAIRKYADVLRSANASKEEHVEALKFLVHFVGDVHQPLHASYADDKGGNSVKVTWMGKPTNLHAVWDYSLIEQQEASGGSGGGGGSGGDWIKMAARLRDSIDPRVKQPKEALMNPDAWANESLTITRRLYLELPKDGTLDKSYFDRNIGTVEDRLQTAGVRLAMLLNSIFDGDETSLVPAASQPTSDPKVAEPSVFGKIIEGEACGGAGGHVMYVVSVQKVKPVKVVVRKTWMLRGKETTADSTYVVKPGEEAKVKLGCSEQKLEKGETRTFKWEIVSAKFDD